MFRSLVDSNLQVIDRRHLRLSGSYFSLSQEQADEITRRIYDYINDMFGSSFVLDWTIERRALKNMGTSFRERKLKSGAYMVIARGNVRCDRVYNKTTLRKYEREICYPSFPLVTFGDQASVDYDQYYNTQVRPFLGDPVQLKNAIQDLFDLEGRVNLGSCLSPDLLAYSHSAPMVSTELFHGGFRLTIPFYCLCDEVDLWGERFYEFGKELAESFPHTNVCVYVVPAPADSYTRYFSTNRVGLNTVPGVPLMHRFLEELYIKEICWAHFISKETQTLRESDLKVADDCILLTELRGGVQAVRVKNPISAVSIADLKSMKRYLYPMVMPRTSTFPAKWLLRSYWEYVPLFENELTVTEAGISFQHHGKVDLETARKLLQV